MKKLGFACCVLVIMTALHGCYAPAPPAGGGDGSVSQQPFSVEVGVEKTQYTIGEKIIISVRAAQDCYLTLYDISTIGEVTQIFPNEFAIDNLIQGGHIYPIPDKDDKFDFEITGPGGMERVRGVCTIEDVNLVEDGKIDASGTFPTISQKSRGEFDDSLDAKLQVMPTERWAEASVTFQVLQ